MTLRPHLQEVLAAIPLGATDPRANRLREGAIDGRGRVAWSEADENDVETLRISDHGQLLFERRLAVTDTTDWGYEGCSVDWIAWFGDHVVALTRERGHSYVWSFSLLSGHSEKRISAPSGTVRNGDLLSWLDRDSPGLVRVVSLPSLEWLLPIPVAGAPFFARVTRASDRAIQVEEDHRPSPLLFGRLTLPSPDQRMGVGDARAAAIADAVKTSLPPHRHTAFVVESIAMPFWTVPSTKWSPSPAWISVYWYEYLLKKDRLLAALFLVLLDSISAPLPESDPEIGWDPAWDGMTGAVTLALHHVRRQARVLAHSCRTGKFPPGWSCLFFEPAPGRAEFGTRVDRADLPPALQTVFDTILPTRPSQRFNYPQKR